MWDEVRRLRAEGMTVFITTHYLDEADALCDRIAIMDHGEIVAEGTPDELKREISGDVVTVGVAGRHRRAGAPSCSTASRTRDAAETVDEPACGSTSTDGATAIPQILRALDGAGHRADVDRAAPAQPRRRLPDQDRPLAARIVRACPGDRARQGEIMKLARDTWLIFQRQILAGAAQPGLDLRRRLPAAVRTCCCSPRCSSRHCRPSRTANFAGDAYRIFVPGLLVLLAIFGGLFQRLRR